MRTAVSWLGGLALAMAGAYLACTLFPAPPRPELLAYFTPGQIADGRAYSQPLRIAFILGTGLQCGLLVWLTAGQRDQALSRWALKAAGGRPTAASLLLLLLLLLALQLISLPLDFFSGFLWQRQWGFATGGAGAWLLDHLKSETIILLPALAGAALLLTLMRRLPRLWWLAAAALLSVWIMAASYLWPVYISPLFNRFTPVSDPAVTEMTTRLADRAGLPVKEVLMMDASRRTSRANAYFAGIGDTRQIVLYDNLLHNYSVTEIEAVVAHELAHWRQNHIIKGVLWGIAGNIIAWGFIFLLLRPLCSRRRQPPPQLWLFMLLFIYLGSFINLPVQNLISRHMEREADAIGVMLTGDPAAAIRLQISLAVKNRSDVYPPAYIRLFGSHPSAYERIMALRPMAQ